jgi:argininosuccinate lyase
VLLVGVGRFVQDLLQWTTAEFGYLRLGEGFVQCSTIMPQKRNPVALEHARAIASKALGQAQAIVTVVHNTPFGDIVDTEDDLQPLVFSTFGDASRGVRLVAAAMRTAEFDVGGLGARAAEGWTTLTELADTLVRDQHLPFSTAHAVAARLIAARQAAPDRPLATLLDSVAQELLGRPLGYSEQELGEMLSPAHFVGVRRTLGGPAPGETARALAISRDALQQDESRLAALREALAAGESRLVARSRAL